MPALHRRHPISSLVAVVVGAILGFGLHHELTGSSPERSVDLALRDRRRTDPAPTRSHHHPPQLPAADGAADPTGVSRGLEGRDPTRPGVGPPIAYASRDPSEWQGMLVNTTFQARCDVSSRCGLAMACHTGHCGPCSNDSECAAGEMCSMQHCVIAPLAACRTRADCAAGELCMLTGYASDARGNASMRAYCSGNPPAEARRQEDEQAALEVELAQADRIPSTLATTDPGTPEGLVHLLQD
jgi:hypothetical protein